MHHVHRGDRYGAAERVAAVCAAVRAGAEDAEHLAPCDNGRHRIEATGERLAEDVHVGSHVVVIAREQLACAAEPRLDLVGHEQHVALLAEVGELAQPPIGRNQDARFGLDRLDEHGTGVRPDGATRGLDVTERDDAESRRERPEAALVVRVRREADDGRRTPVEVVLEHDDLRLLGGNAFHVVAPAARGLDGRLDRLGARVHRQHHLHLAEVRELLAEHRELVVAEGARGERDLLRLLDERGKNARVRVPLIDGRVRAQAVEVALALDVPHPRALRALDDEIERMVVVCAPAVFEGDEGVGIAGGEGGSHL